MKHFSLLLFCPLLFLACEDKDLAAYAETQACLDKANASSAEACIAKLSPNDISPRANGLRCAANFISNGLDTSRLAEIFSGIQEDDTGMKTALEHLVFTEATNTEAKNKAGATFDYCNDSGSIGLALFGSFAYTATITADLVGFNFGAYDPDNPGTYPNLSGASGAAPTSDVEIGTAVLNIQNTYCALASANTDVCGQVADIIGSNTDVDAIGAALRAYID